MTTGLLSALDDPKRTSISTSKWQCPFIVQFGPIVSNPTRSNYLTVVTRGSSITDRHYRVVEMMPYSRFSRSLGLVTRAICRIAMVRFICAKVMQDSCIRRILRVCPA